MIEIIHIYMYNLILKALNKNFTIKKQGINATSIIGQRAFLEEP